MIDAKTLFAQAQTMRDEMIKNFRALHRHPELGGKETWTQAYLIERLREMGIEAQTYPGMTCVVALIKGAPIVFRLV